MKDVGELVADPSSKKKKKSSLKKRRSVENPTSEVVTLSQRATISVNSGRAKRQRVGETVAPSFSDVEVASVSIGLASPNDTAKKAGKEVPLLLLCSEEASTKGAATEQAAML